MPIEKVLKEVWFDVDTAWKYHQINSERCLQAVMHSSLRKHLGTFAWQIFVEPEMVPEGDGKKYPDLVVAENGEIRAIIELKFCPQGYVEYREDIEKLLKFERSRNVEYHLDLDVCTGRYTEQVFKITEETRFVFAVIARDDAEAVDFGIGSDHPALNVPTGFCHLAGKITGRTEAPPQFTTNFTNC